MNRNKLLIVVIVVLVATGVVVGVVALTTGSKDKTADMTHTMTMNKTTQKPNTQKAVEADTVTIRDFAYSPAAIKVKVGTKVTWTNQDSVSHTITADEPSSDAPDSQLLSKGESYSFTFNKAGTYNYHCQLHPYMKATVVVTE